MLVRCTVPEEKKIETFRSLGQLHGKVHL